jgi:membrane complex biogenesis BtpA family protein
MQNKLFNTAKPVIGMVHVGALPGTPAHHLPLGEITSVAVREARIYRDHGIHGLIIENMHDVPYLRGSVGPEITAAMTVVARAVKDTVSLPVGIQILAAANVEAIAVAHAAGLDFIRAEGYVFAHVADEGLIESCAARLLRYRKSIDAERVQIWADIKKKHSSHAITSDISLKDTAAAVEFMRGDAVIVTGGATGLPPNVDDVRAVKESCQLPVVLGSGVDPDNIGGFYKWADGFIVGSFFKQDGLWSRPLDEQRIDRFMNRIKELAD